MRIFIAGATGAIGRPLVRRLLAAGHEVAGLTRSPERARELESAGVEAHVGDALDRDAVGRAIAAARPEVIVQQLTDLPSRFQPRRIGPYYARTSRLRTEGTAALIDAGLAAGCTRLVAQSIAFLYAPEGDPVKDEDARPYTDAQPPFGDTVAALVEMERAVLETPGLRGCVLRYGFLYGPGTWHAEDGSLGRDVRRRRLPIVGTGEGISSFVHVEDAALATQLAIESGATGIYNIVDDEPARQDEWVPAFAAALGAPAPRRVPVWLARLVAGGGMVSMASRLAGASNARARRELGWQPLYPSWRTGFAEAPR